MSKYTFGVRQIIVLECNKSSHKKETGKKKWNKNDSIGCLLP